MNENLLHAIQTEAVDGSTDLPTLLRKCRVLAQRLGNDDLKNWVMHELDGYPSGSELPAYRILQNLPIFGDYHGPANLSLTNVQIPKYAIREECREILMQLSINQGVAELKSEIANSSDGFLRLSMDQIVRKWINYKSIASHMVLMEVYRHISATILEGVLETIRNRILDFTLELEEFASQTGKPLDNLKNEHPREVQHVFNTHILGSVANLNQAGNHVTQNAAIQVGDLDSVGRRLREIGLSEVDIVEFQGALAAEPSSGEGFSGGEKVKSQLSKVIKMAADGVLKVTSAVASSVVTEIVKGYYGV